MATKLGWHTESTYLSLTTTTEAENFERKEERKRTVRIIHSCFFTRNNFGRQYLYTFGQEEISYDELVME